MRTPDELGRVAWGGLTHAYGSAADVPGMIRALYAAGGDAEAEADDLIDGMGPIDTLYVTLLGQDTVYPATAHAVPFLAHAARYAPAPVRPELLLLLATFTEAEHVGPADAVTAVRAAVAGEVPALLPGLRDRSRDVRRATLRVVAAVADLLGAGLRDRARTAADALHEGDPAAAVRADAMVLRARLGGEVAPLDDPSPDVRLAAALVTAARSGPPYPPEVVRVLAEVAAPPDPWDDEGSAAEPAYDLPWPGTGLPGTGVGVVEDVLAADPDAAFEVAARWIQDGDTGRRGSLLAERIVQDWRDREPRFLDLALDALAHAGGPGELANRVAAMARWVALDPAPHARVRDTLYAHAVRPEQLPAREALLGLVRARDPRALDVLPGLPNASALRAAAVHFPAEGARLVPVLRRELAAGAAGAEVIALIDALAALGPAAVDEAEAELVACLREDRAALTAARTLGAAGVRSRESVALLRGAMSHRDASTRATAAVAHFQLTGDTAATLDVLRPLLDSPGEAPWHLARLEALGPAAAPLLPLVTALLTEPYAPTRVAAAEATFWLTADPARATPVLTAAVTPAPLGLQALRALAAMGPVPPQLHPTLTHFATSPTRILGPSTREEPHPDLQLRALARTLLPAPPD